VSWWRGKTELKSKTKREVTVMLRKIARIHPDNLGAFSPAHPNKATVRSLYDVQTLPHVGGANKIQFFRQPEGSALGGGVTKTRQATNLTGNGMLPNGEAMLVQHIEVRCIPGVLPARAGAGMVPKYISDLNAMLLTGLLHLRVSNSDAVWDGPLSIFPPETRMVADGVALDGALPDDTASRIIELASNGGRPYDFEPFSIIGGQGIDFAIEYPDGSPVLDSGVDAQLMLRLVGDYYEMKVAAA
jgi:hypothetical protein